MLAMLKTLLKMAIILGHSLIVNGKNLTEMRLQIYWKCAQPSVKVENG